MTSPVPARLFHVFRLAVHVLMRFNASVGIIDLNSQARAPR